MVEGLSALTDLQNLEYWVEHKTLFTKGIAYEHELLLREVHRISRAKKIREDLQIYRYRRRNFVEIIRILQTRIKERKLLDLDCPYPHKTGAIRQIQRGEYLAILIVPNDNTQILGLAFINLRVTSRKELPKYLGIAFSGLK